MNPPIGRGGGGSVPLGGARGGEEGIILLLEVEGLVHHHLSLSRWGIGADAPCAEEREGEQTPKKTKNQSTARGEVDAA
jgi:hypothetical protein